MIKDNDEVKGRVKEAASSLTGNKKLKSEGKADRLAGEAKAKVKKAEVKVERLIDKTKDAPRNK